MKTITLLFVSAVFSLSDSSDPYFQIVQLENQINYDELYTKNTLKVDKDRLSLYVYTPQDLMGSQITLADAQNITNVSSFDISRPTYIYTHGWTTMFNSIDGREIREAILSTSDSNVLIYNWDYCADNILYTTAWGCVEGVGNYLGIFLTELSTSYGYSLDNVTVIGHSLGAHVSGFAGKATNGTVGVIVGLDPAGPLFFKNLPNHRLSRTDAKYVHVIHTSRIVFGVNYNVGIADFWANGGRIQNGGSFYTNSYIISLF